MAGYLRGVDYFNLDMKSYKDVYVLTLITSYNNMI